MLLHRHYCLECNQTVGESTDDCDMPQDHVVEEVCQTCAQHRAAQGSESGIDPGSRAATPDP